MNKSIIYIRPAYTLCTLPVDFDLPRSAPYSPGSIKRSLPKVQTVDTSQKVSNVNAINRHNMTKVRSPTQQTNKYTGISHLHMGSTIYIGISHLHMGSTIYIGISHVDQSFTQRPAIYTGISHLHRGHSV